MNHNPKDAVVDLSKLIQSQSQTPVQTNIPTNSANSIAAMLTSCNEGTSLKLVEHEQFTYNGKNNQAKDD